jgi:hypothetical protein
MDNGWLRNYVALVVNPQAIFQPVWFTHECTSTHTKKSRGRHVYNTMSMAVEKVITVQLCLTV